MLYTPHITETEDRSFFIHTYAIRTILGQSWGHKKHEGEQEQAGRVHGRRRHGDMEPCHQQTVNGTVPTNAI
jgi:hypothetical protein